ncbi:MAG: nucleotide-binding protein [Nitrososphaeraceae archaeon]|nr:nucleotide-binding protein [Nitrososphaeraceae archaeon]
MSTNEILTPRQKFIAAANRSKILLNKCKNCGHMMLETVIYCEKCYHKNFESTEVDGIGSVETYTIQSVAPEGFEDVESYAWVVFKLDNILLRTSGFLPGIMKPEDLPLKTRVRVVGFNHIHGLVLEKTIQ